MRTRLVLERSERPEQTAVAECDVHTALCRGLAEHLEDLSISMAGRDLRLARVYDTWPEPEDAAEYPALLVRGESEDGGEHEARGLTPKLDVADRLPDGRFLTQAAEYAETLVAELRCFDPAQRAGMALLFERALSPVLWMYGCRLALPHYYGQHAEYEPVASGFRDTEETAMQRFRTAIFRVKARVPIVRIVSVPSAEPRPRSSVVPAGTALPEGGFVG